MSIVRDNAAEAHLLSFLYAKKCIKWHFLQHNESFNISHNLTQKQGYFHRLWCFFRIRSPYMGPNKSSAF
jgi:hypothetical protein